jgi:hypothetical protein
MKNNSPDFYLTSSEGYALTQPHECRKIKRISTGCRNDLLLIKIEPPLIGQQYGLGDKDIDDLIIATRFQGDSLFPVKKWPVYVHLARPLIKGIENIDYIRDDEFEVIAWAELYPTKKDAEANITAYP